MSRSAGIVAIAGLSAIFHPAPLQARVRTPRPRPGFASSLDVRPSAEIEERVVHEVARARSILDDLNTENLFASPYLIDAIYYHDGIFAGFPVNRQSADPERRIIEQICQMFGPEDKARFVGLLHELWDASQPPGPEELVTPIANPVMHIGPGTHQDAIDLFASEGSLVQSVSRGIVILADHGWTAGNVFSTSSRKGGNAVIIFDPDQDRFYRFCHLSTVLVTPGEFVVAGDVIGTVGHSGLNASRPGHGRHLHFEINEYRDGQVSVVMQQQLRGLLLAWPVPSPTCEPATLFGDDCPLLDDWILPLEN